jgi:hypothetical protein
MSIDETTESEIVTVISPDDGSGWIKVETSSNQIGLVPATYVQILCTDAAISPSSAPPEATTGPTPVPSRLKRG